MLYIYIYIYIYLKFENDQRNCIYNMKFHYITYNICRI